MKRLTSFLLACAMAFACAGCATQQNDDSANAEQSRAGSSAAVVPQQDGGDEEVTLTLWGGTILVRAASFVLEQYLEDYPAVEIVYESFPKSEYPTKMRLQLMSGDGEPDIMIMHDYLVPAFMEQNWIMDITDSVDMDNFVSEGFRNVTKDGRIYGLPNQSAVMSYFYRDDVFDELGLDVPSNLDEYLSVGRTLRANDLYIDSFSVTEDPQEIWKVFTHLMGGAWFDGDGKLIMDQEESKAREALERLTEAYDEGLFYPANHYSDDHWIAINDGLLVSRVAPNFFSPSFESNVDPNGKGGFGSWTITTPPKFDSGAKDTYLASTEYYLVNSFSQNQAAALDVITYLAGSEEAALRYAQVDGDLDPEGDMIKMTNFYRPGLQLVSQHSREWDSFGGQKVNAVVADMLLGTVGELPYTDGNTPEMESIVNDNLTRYFMGSDRDSQALIATIVQQIGAM